MNILMIDKVSIFAQGMELGLKQHIPDIKINFLSHMDNVLNILSDEDISLIIVDGEIDKTLCLSFLDDLFIHHPKIPVVVSLNVIKKHSLRLYLRHHALSIFSKDTPLDIIGQVLKTVSAGMICLPNTPIDLDDEPERVSALSDRQREILKFIAAGESNKQISRRLNISAGTVKAHLESIFKRLNVKNRTQAAMMYSLNEH